MDILKKIIPHICVILAGMFLIFTIIERFNSGMTLIDNDMAKVLLFIFSVVAIVVSVMLIARQRRED